MCVVCGCGESGEHPVGSSKDSASGVKAESGLLDFGANAAGVSVPGLGVARAIRLEEDILGANKQVALRNRQCFEDHGVLALNLVSSPGSGKTTLLCETLRGLQRTQPELSLLVVEGDQQTQLDAERIRETGVPAVQVNTGKGCHLDAPMLERAFAALHQHLPHVHHHHQHHHVHGQHHDHPHGQHHQHGQHQHHHAHDQHHDHPHGHQHDKDAGHDHPHAAAPSPALLFIENVGNLVCPALWDLGEDAKVVVLSVTEGEDKPLKYPDMFAAARLMLLTKIDLLPHVRFDADRCEELARRINPGIEILRLSAYTGEGMQAWLAWVGSAVQKKRSTLRARRVAQLRTSIARQQAQLAQLEASSPS